MSLPCSPLRLLPTAATFVGWDSHPLEFRAFSRRTDESRLVLSHFHASDRVPSHVTQVKIPIKYPRQVPTMIWSREKLDLLHSVDGHQPTPKQSQAFGFGTGERLPNLTQMPTPSTEQH